MQIRSDNVGDYISNELKDLFLTSAVIHDLTPPYSPESIVIVEHFNQILNTIACSMTIAAPDFLCLCVEASNMGAYLKNRLLHTYLPSSTIPFIRAHGKRQKYHTLTCSEVNVSTYQRGRPVLQK
jgi:hypothetical protein